jgi:serine protease Do
MRNLVLGLLVTLSLATAAEAVAAPRWGWLGVRIRDLSEQETEEISRRHGLREGFGALIVEVLKETPAETAGVQPGDVVVAVSGRPVVDTRTLQRYIGGAPVGEPLAVTVLRKDVGRQRLSITVGGMPDDVASDRVAVEFGFVVREPEPQPESGGARPPARPAVAIVVPRSRAEAAGLKTGDVLLEINGRQVTSVAAVRQALLAVPLDRALHLVVGRERERLPLVVAAPRS